MVRSDPIRVFEAVIPGISFLGAGTIIFHRGTERVEGITTAASYCSQLRLESQWEWRSGFSQSC
jgi:uncharacterized membrane protein YhiD involved in acid resistance